MVSWCIVALLRCTNADDVRMAKMNVVCCSGAHVNPAVTLGSLIAGTIGEIMSVLYFVCQLFGGILGALLVRV